MWIFLVTEVLFFGGLFLTYTINAMHSAPLRHGSNTLTSSWAPATPLC